MNKTMIYNKWKQGLESTAPNLAGPVELEAGSTVEYTITDYSNLYTYEIEVPFGSATITDNTISWSIPIGTTQGDYVFTLKRNGLVYSYIIRVVILPETPSITYPTTGLTINDLTFTATSSPFSSPSGSLHVSSDWQVATDSAFSNIVFQSLNNTTNKTSIQITVPSENTYYIRVRYKDSNNNYSQWSSVVSFNIIVIPNSEFQILTASDKAGGDYFGWSVSISGNVAIIGAYYASPGGTTNAGKAYIFRYNGTSWIEEAILIASDKAAGDNFGRSVSISGNVAIVGANRADPDGTTDAGEAYIFV